MSVEMIFKDVENEALVPRLGGCSLLPADIDWPINSKGDKLTLVLSLPTDFLNEARGLNLPQASVVSVFTTYEKDDYFLDLITFHGDEEGWGNIKKGFTNVLIHKVGAARNEAEHLIPAQALVLGDAIDLDINEDEELDCIYCGSLIGNQPSLLQFKDLALYDYHFCLQIYGGDFPSDFQDIFYLNDSVGYLYINKAHDEGIFFTQCT